MKFHVVIPVFNRLALTIRCLESLVAQTDQGINIVLIDDGSTDGTSEVIRKRFDKLQIIAGDGTLWWSGAANVGIRQVLLSAAADDYILLVNNDTYFDLDFVTRCRDAVKKYPKTLIGSVVVGPSNGRILQGGIRINWYSAKYTWLNQGKRIDDFPPGHVEAVSVVTGRGVLIPCETYRELGLYENHCLEQHGDTELARRANLKGYPLLVDYDLVTYNSDLMATPTDTDYRPTDLFQYFFGFRSKMRLRTRYWFAIKTTTNPLQAACFFVCDFSRVLMHFLSRLRLGVTARRG